MIRVIPLGLYDLLYGAGSDPDRIRNMLGSNLTPQSCHVPFDDCTCFPALEDWKEGTEKGIELSLVIFEGECLHGDITNAVSRITSSGFKTVGLSPFGLLKEKRLEFHKRGISLVVASDPSSLYIAGGLRWIPAINCVPDDYYILAGVGAEGPFVNVAFLVRQAA